MSEPKFDSDGFQIVKIKKGLKNKSTKVPCKNIYFEKQENKIDIDKSYRRIQICVKDLEVSEYWKNVTKAVSNTLKHKKIVEIVCFGLGHIGECNISRYQLALLLCLKNTFKPEKIFVHDPIFYLDECEILKKFELNVIEENTEGSYIINRHGVTLVYLPHCPKQLTNNFLWSNWTENLENCILLCNSFTSLIENNINRVVNETVPFIYKIYPFVHEVLLENTFTYNDIFNDSSLHHFPSDKLKLLPKGFWDKQEKPKYENTEEFITSLMIEKLTI
nr:SRR1-like protein isoform X1 [Vanessa tameamea]